MKEEERKEPGLEITRWFLGLRVGWRDVFYAIIILASHFVVYARNTAVSRAGDIELRKTIADNQKVIVENQKAIIQLIHDCQEAKPKR